MSRFPWPLYFLKYYIECRFLGKRDPILGGYKITNLCNMECIHCPFWKRQDKTALTFEEIREKLKELHCLGVRILIIEGGEPFLWKDGRYGLEDVVKEAKKYFYSVGITTNGTFPLDSDANALWVSIDGLKETHDSIRGESFDKIMENIERSAHPNILANITINTKNAGELTSLVKFLSLKVKGITIQFHYPYEKIDDLFIPLKERGVILDDLITLKDRGYPLLDSVLCLKALKDNSWACHDWMIANMEPDGKINLGCYVKKRGEVNCDYCGFAAHTEISLAFDLRFSPILVGKKIFQYHA
jgi:MoaA/NifB/PqqE/SkfB family radical SAM enzyme